MKRIFLALPLLIGACAADGTPLNTAPASTSTIAVQPTTGEIVMVEAIAPVSQRGGNAALQIGASVLGALIPGPWGSVAGVTTGQVGSLALANADAQSSRYHVRLSDGTIQTFEQPSAPTLVIGTPVDILTLANGSRQIIPSVPVVKASSLQTI